MKLWQPMMDGMIATIRHHIRASTAYTGEAELDTRVEAVMRAVPRHRFVPAWEMHNAYADAPLSIGHGQTISQPFIVALMSQLLCLSGSERVLEIGTGCGYQTAVLAGLCAEVISVECIPELSCAAERQLDEMGLSSRVRLVVGNGWYGWPQDAPFDAILVTAAATRLPEALVEQLGDGGRLLIPLGEPGCPQQLTLFTRHADRLDERVVLPVAFVPLLQHPEA